MKRFSIELVDISIHAVSTEWWRQLLEGFLREGLPFEIRCWREETDVIRRALSYGSPSREGSSVFQTAVAGLLTDDMIRELLSRPKPEDPEQMTEIFSLRIDGRLWLEHYGKEIYLDAPSEEELKRIKKIMDPIREYFIFGEYEIT